MTGNHFLDTRTEQSVALRGFDVGISMAAAQDAVGLGATMVRIPVPWSLIEPQAPVGDVHTWAEDRLALLDQEVAYLEQQNVQVLIDFHQVHWSAYFGRACQPNSAACGSGQGIPDWYYADGRFPPSTAGVIDAEAAFFSTEANRTARLYAAFAQMMVARYSAFANVVGFEILNEPQGGSLNQHLTARQMTAVMLHWQLRVATAMRQVDAQRAFFISVRGGGEGVGTADLSVFRPVRPIVLDFHDFFNGMPTGGLDQLGDSWVPGWTATHNQFVKDYAGTLASQQRVLMVAIRRAALTNCPLYVGEWGARWDDTNAAAYQEQMLSLFDRYGVSWTRWILNTTDRFRLIGAGNTLSDQALQVGAALAVPPSRTAFEGLPILELAFATGPRRFSQAITLHLRISRASTVTAVVSRFRGAVVRHLYRASYLHPNRPLVLVWKRRDDAGRDVRPGLYVVRVDVTDTRGEHVWRSALVQVVAHP